MIVQEYFRTRKIDGVRLFKTYSDENKYIKKVSTGEIYDAAIDPETELENRVYLETDEYISEENEVEE